MMGGADPRRPVSLPRRRSLREGNIFLQFDPPPHGARRAEILQLLQANALGECV